jgi:Cu/Ag efflux protein CusF
MMKKVLSNRLTFMLIAAVFMLSFAGLAVSQESQQQEVTKVTGVISDISPDAGQVRIMDASGILITLTAGSGVDLEDFSVGDQVEVEHTPDMVIRSITKQ